MYFLCLWCYSYSVIANQISLSVDNLVDLNESIQVKLDAPFFRFVAYSAVNVIKKTFRDLPIPDIQLDTGVPVLGNIHLSLTGNSDLYQRYFHC